MVTQLLIGALALGIAGFDPLGSLVLLAGLGLGVRRRGVIALGAAAVLTSEVLALAGALGLAEAARASGIHPPHVPHLVWLVLVAAVGLGLVVWALYYIRPHQSGEEDAGRAKPRSGAASALALSGLLVGLSSLIDPAFWAMVVHAGRWPRADWSALEATIWVLCSHILLIVLVICYLTVGEQRVRRIIDDVMNVHALAVRRTVSIFAGLFGLVLLADAGAAVATGSWLFTI